MTRSDLLAKIAVAAVCLAASANASAADLIGSEFSLRAIYQETAASPVLEIGVNTTAIVSAERVEFPNVGVLDTNQPGVFLVNTAIDVGGNFIEIDFDNAGSGRFANGVQNTYIFTFDTSRGLQFDEASINSSLTTLALPASNLQFSGNQLFLNVSNIPYNSSSFVRIDIPGISVPDMPPGTVPEPTTWALMIGGYAAVGGTLRRRRRVEVRSA